MLSKLYNHILINYASLFWRFRHLLEPGWVKSYASKEAYEHPHRDLLLKVISKYEPINSIFEIGCATGTNLVRLKEQYPECHLMGNDVNSSACKVANLLGFNVYKQRHPTFPNKWMLPNADIYLTDASLIYFTPTMLDMLFKNLMAKKFKALIFCEWHDYFGSVTHKGHWIHDYNKLLPGCKITKIPDFAWSESKAWQEYGNIIEYDNR